MRLVTVVERGVDCCRDGCQEVSRRRGGREKTQFSVIPPLLFPVRQGQGLDGQGIINHSQALSGGHLALPGGRQALPGGRQALPGDRHALPGAPQEFKGLCQVQGVRGN